MANESLYVDLAVPLTPTAVAVFAPGVTVGQYRFDKDGVQGVACQSAVVSNLLGATLFLKINVLTSSVSATDYDVAIPTSTFADLVSLCKTTIKSVSMFAASGTATNAQVKGVPA